MFCYDKLILFKIYCLKKIGDCFMKKSFTKRFQKDFFMLYIGLFLFVVFMLLWFLTLPTQESQLPYFPPIVDEPIDEPVDETVDETVETVAEKLERITEENQRLEDNLTYSIALRTNNRAHCDSIKDSDLRDKCLEEVEGYEEIVIDTRSEDEILDDAQILIARRTGDLSYCDSIKDSDLKDECLALVQEE